MYNENIEKLEEIMRRYGLDGEDAFFTIASFYIDSYVTKFSKRLSDIYSKGLNVRNQYNVSDYKDEIDSIIRQDTSGDMLPIFYQQFLSKRFRESSGKFFTPKPIARAMVELLTPFDSAIIIDPTCGSGTFLKEASNRWGKLKSHLVGNDVDPLLVDLTELSLSIGASGRFDYELFSTNIYEPDIRIGKIFQKADYVIANPPFSIPISKFSGESRLFELGYRNSDALFLDFAFRLLRPSGRLVCLLPHSIITNDEFLNLRSAIEKYWFLLGIITLPECIFYTTAKSSSRADIVVLEKIGHREKPTKTFFCHVSSVGVPLKTYMKSTDNQLMELVSSADIQELLRRNTWQ